MSHSHAQSTQLTCPHCNRPFDAEIWLIVDAAERPDLFDKVKQGKLYDLTCPTAVSSNRRMPRSCST
ncbi:MAG: CpXC domain-containing protein [Thermoflexales bacterium]|nr:CpXC domain-containing protein [Thermoflexales bacterium]MDW8351907.1 CpXC domain-containing protein [Anaerolineae bacterium]